jgi:hypothetical protein
MKSLIRLTIITLLITIASESFGQTFGVKGGVNFSNMLIKESELYVPYNTSVANPKMKIGFHIEGVIEYPVFDLFSIESGLFLTTLGTKLTTEEPFGATTLITKAKHNLYYLGIPLAAKVPFSIKGLDFYGSVGGYAGIGLMGNADTISTFGDLKETTKGKIAWGSEQGVDNLKRFDYGLTFGAGMKYNSCQIGVFYNLGLANISSDSEIGSIAKNRFLGISVGYMFGENRKSVPVIPIADKGIIENKEKSNKAPAVKSGGRKSESKSERQRMEKMRADSIVAAWAEEEKIRIAKIKADSVESVRIKAEKIEAERISKEKIKADSISAAQKVAALKEAKEIVVYRVQFASNTTKKGSYNITIGEKNYSTWEYSYSGAFRSTVGEFKTFQDAMKFQKIVRQSGYPQAFVVAFKNNVRSTDPTLFK